MRKATLQGIIFRNTKQGITTPLLRVTGCMQRAATNSVCTTDWRNFAGNSAETARLRFPPWPRLQIPTPTRSHPQPT